MDFGFSFIHNPLAHTVQCTVPLEHRKILTKYGLNMHVYAYIFTP